MKKIDLKDFEETYQKYVHTGELVLAQNKLDQPLVCYPNDIEYDQEFVKQNNILAQHTHHSQGCFVAFPGDFVVLYFAEESEVMPFLTQIRDKFVEKLKEILPEHDIFVDNNDIMLDNKKISGASYSDYMAFFVSYDPDPELIKHISKKDSVKVPGGLKETGLPLNRIEFILEDIIKDYEERR